MTSSIVNVKHLRVLLIAVALLYAFLCGLRTVSDTDTGWHLAGGRYTWETGQIPSVDVMSFTAEGRPWIYPIASQVALYLLLQAGGFAALSFLNAFACMTTVGVAPLRGGTLTLLLAIVAAPSIAHRTVPRADLFTMILFAAFLWLLWRHFLGESVRLWLLPALMAAWVNLHLGFGAGVALLVAYVVWELGELPFAARRAAAAARLKRAAPWLAATLAATLLNPWGWGIYRALLRQNDLIKYYGDFFNEWTAVRWGTARLEAFDWRNPESGYWWVLAAAILAVGGFVWQRRIGVALTLAGIAAYSLMHIRFQPLLVIAAVVMCEAAFRVRQSAEQSEEQYASHPSRRIAPLRWVVYGAIALVVALAGVRAADLVSNRYYLASGQLSHFGAGATWWFPEGAAAFIEREQLPGNIFHDYNTGGYLTWRLGPKYKTYVDGRAIPFGPELFFRQRQLLGQPPDSAEWVAESAQRGINVILLPVARFLGLGLFPLGAYCQSKTWQVAYLDSTAIVLARTSALSPEQAARMRVDCSRVNLLGGAAAQNPAEQYSRYMNAASIYYVLARDAEALDAAQKAEAIFAADSNLHLLKGQIYQARNLPREAEAAYVESLRIRTTDAALVALGLLQAGQKRYLEAGAQLERAVEISQAPYERLVTLGQIQIALAKFDEALAHFDRAEAASPYQREAAGGGSEFRARLAEGRARAWRGKGDVQRAISFAEAAAQHTPQSERRWILLAGYYEAAGRAAESAAARQRAEAVRAASSPVN